MAKRKNFHTFEQWTTFDIERKLAVVPIRQSDSLTAWLNTSDIVPQGNIELLNELSDTLFRYHTFWNEQELLTKFIAPVFRTVQFDSKDYNLFHERSLKAKIKEYFVSGIVDGMVALGDAEPVKPYFFLHEYKRMKQSESDPLGQLLIAMLAARELNQDGKPIYGCYIIGRYWTFVLLEGDTYAQTQGYDATDPQELQTIWLILNKTKQIIIQRVAEEFPDTH